MNLSFWRLLVKERVARGGPQIQRKGTSAVCDTDLRHPRPWLHSCGDLCGVHTTPPPRPYPVQIAELVAPEDFKKAFPGHALCLGHLTTAPSIRCFQQYWDTGNQAQEPRYSGQKSPLAAEAPPPAPRVCPAHKCLR